MKKHWKTLVFTAITSAVLLCGMSAFAAPQNVTAKIFSAPVFVEGHESYCWNPQGQQTDYLIYNGSTYIPIRTAGEWLGKNIEWDNTTQTVTLSGTTEKIYREQTTSEIDIKTWSKYRDEGMTVQLCPDIKVIVDGKEQSFKNAKGEPVYPLSYNNMTYLPVRNIGELLGMTVTFQQENGKEQSAAIFMRTKMTDAQIQECQQYVDTLKQGCSYKAFEKAGKIPEPLKKSYQISGGEVDDIFEIIRQGGLKAEEVKQVFPLVEESFKILEGTSKPSYPLFDAYITKMQEKLPAAKAVYESVKQAAESGSGDVSGALHKLQDAMDSVTVNINWMNTVLTEKY